MEIQDLLIKLKRFKSIKKKLINLKRFCSKGKKKKKTKAKSKESKNPLIPSKNRNNLKTQQDKEKNCGCFNNSVRCAPTDLII